MEHNTACLPREKCILSTYTQHKLLMYLNGWILAITNLLFKVICHMYKRTWIQLIKIIIFIPFLYSIYF
jgi:hypothetical protein